MDRTYPEIPDGTDAGAVWSRRLADEFWSGPVTPLTFSLLAPAMVEQMASRALRVAGLDALATQPVFRLRASHVYVNAALLADVVDLLPGLVQSEGLLDLLPAPARARIRPATALEGLPSALVIASKFLWREPSWLPWQRAAAFDAACARVRTVHAGLPPAASFRSPSALATEIRRTQDGLGDYLAVVSWGIVFAYVFYHLLGELVRRWAPDLAAEAAFLTIGLPGVVSLEAYHEVLVLGAQLERHDAWREAAREALPEVAREVAADEGAAGSTYRRILTRHGHRLTGRDLAQPTWREAPEALLALALRSARTHTEREAPARRRDAAVAAIRRRLGAGWRGPRRRAAFRAVLVGAQRFCLVRENMRYHADFFLARLRALALTLGQHLVDRGTCTDPTDVFFVDHRELDELAATPSRPAVPLGPRITERRHAFARDAAAPPPLTLAEATDTGAPSGSAPRELAGEVGAPGSCEGRAQVVGDTDDFDRVAPGDVIVAAYADPAWTPLLDLASGLVLEAGGQLSHGAIVARELGIPALVNVRDARRWIRSGDRIRIDTAAARVFNLSRP